MASGMANKWFHWFLGDTKQFTSVQGCHSAKQHSDMLEAQS